VIIGLGATFGLAWTAALAPQKHRAGKIDHGLWVLFGALLVGRLLHVGLAWSYYSERLLDIPQIWLGGLSGAGALAGGLLALGLLAFFTRQNLGVLADGYTPLAAALVTSAWLACWADGAVYGAETTAWWGLPARDEWGELLRRQPVQMAAAGLTLALFWFLDRRRNDLKQPGQKASLALFGLGLLILATSFWRVDVSPVWSGLRPEAWAGVGFTLMAGTGYLLTYLSRRKSRKAASAIEILQNTS
jgi:prolipoprotein diacylglyceryltransferase